MTTPDPRRIRAVQRRLRLHQAAFIPKISIKDSGDHAAGDPSGMPSSPASSSGPVIEDGWSPGHGCRPGFGRRGDVLRVSVTLRPRRRMSGSPAPAARLSVTRNIGQNALREHRVMTDDLEPS
jgi:hypothetical protein